MVNSFCQYLQMSDYDFQLFSFTVIKIWTWACSTAYGVTHSVYKGSPCPCYHTSHSPDPHRNLYQGQHTEITDHVEGDGGSDKKQYFITDSKYKGSNKFSKTISWTNRYVTLINKIFKKCERAIKNGQSRNTDNIGHK